MPLVVVGGIHLFFIMKLKIKHIGFFAVAIFIVAIMLWDTDVTISKVVDGNTVELSNGITVKLIGVSSTIEGREFIKERYVNNTSVLIRPDNTNKFNPDDLKKGSMVYAYLIMQDFKKCLNSKLLEEGVCSLVEDTYLSDSLNVYRDKYASSKSEAQLTPTPVTPIIYQNDDIQLPDYVSPNGRVHSHWYTDGNQNIDMIKEACDFDLPYTRNFAVQLAGRSSGSKEFKQICEIFDYCYNKWHYVNDPAGQEYVARASESIHNNLSGDCDDYAVLMASCMLAIGFEPSIITAYRGDGSGHAYAEVCISQFNENDILKVVKSRFPQYTISSLHTSNHDGKKWLNLDWQAGYPGGPYWSSNNKGTYVYSASSNNWHWNGYVGEYYGVSSSQNVTVYDVNGNWYATGLLVESAAKASLRIDNSNYELTSSDKDIFRYMVKNKRLYVK